MATRKSTPTTTRATKKAPVKKNVGARRAAGAAAGDDPAVLAALATPLAELTLNDLVTVGLLSEKNKIVGSALEIKAVLPASLTPETIAALAAMLLQAQDGDNS